MKLGLPVLLLCLSVSATTRLDELRLLGAQGVNLWKLEKAAAAASAASPNFFVQDGSGFGQAVEEDIAGFKAQWFRQPVDHFSKTDNATYLQRYWVNTRHYKADKGGPVIVLDGGETSGMVSVWFLVEHSSDALQNRIPFLDTGL